MSEFVNMYNNAVKKQTLVDVLILNYNDAATTLDFVNSIKDFSCLRKILVVDNHSTDDSLNILRKIENEKVVVIDSGRNGGYGFGNNYGVRYLVENYQSDYILICNPDVVVAENVISRTMEFLIENEKYAVAAPMMNIPGKGCQYSVMKTVTPFAFVMSVELLFSSFFSPLYSNLLERKGDDFIDVFSVAGSLFMINAHKIGNAPIYDENVFLYYEEYVLGQKCKKLNYKIALLSNVSYIHNHSVSISRTYRSVLKKQKVYLRSYRYMVKKYYGGGFFYRWLSYIMSGVSLFEIFIWSTLKNWKKCL